MVIPGCVHSHEIPEKTHCLLVSQECQAKLGITKRVRDGSITLDDYDATIIGSCSTGGDLSVPD